MSDSDPSAGLLGGLDAPPAAPLGEPLQNAPAPAPAFVPAPSPIEQQRQEAVNTTNGQPESYNAYLKDTVPGALFGLSEVIKSAFATESIFDADDQNLQSTTYGNFNDQWTGFGGSTRTGNSNDQIPIASDTNYAYAQQEKAWAKSGESLSALAQGRSRANQGQNQQEEKIFPAPINLQNILNRPPTVSELLRTTGRPDDRPSASRLQNACSVFMSAWLKMDSSVSNQPFLLDSLIRAQQPPSADNRRELVTKFWDWFYTKEIDQQQLLKNPVANCIYIRLLAIDGRDLRSELEQDASTGGVLCAIVPTELFLSHVKTTLGINKDEHVWLQDLAEVLIDQLVVSHPILSKYTISDALFGISIGVGAVNVTVLARSLHHRVSIPEESARALPTNLEAFDRFVSTQDGAVMSPNNTLQDAFSVDDIVHDHFVVPANQDGRITYHTGQGFQNASAKANARETGSKEDIQKRQRETMARLYNNDSYVVIVMYKKILNLNGFTPDPAFLGQMQQWITNSTSKQWPYHPLLPGKVSMTRTRSVFSQLDYPLALTQPLRPKSGLPEVRGLQLYIDRVDFDSSQIGKGLDANHLFSMAYAPDRGRLTGNGRGMTRGNGANQQANNDGNLVIEQQPLGPFGDRNA